MRKFILYKLHYNVTFSTTITTTSMDSVSLYPNAILIGIFTIFVLAYLLKKFTQSSKVKKPPEAAGRWPIIGHLPILAGAELPHITLGGLADKCGSIFTIRVGVHPTLVVSSWKLAKELFTTYDALISSRPKLMMGKLIGYNYADLGFTPYGEYWRGIRKLTAQQVLSNRRLELLKHVRVSEVESFVKELYKQWSKEKNGSNQVLVEMKKLYGDMNLNVVLRMIAGKRYFGASVSSDEKEAARCKKVMREFFSLGELFLVRDALPFLGWLDLGGHEKAMKKTAKELDNIVEEWLDEHRNKKDVNDDDGTTKQDFMDVLLSVVNDINLGEFDANTVCKATSVALLVGGTDSTTVTIIWALALLVNNKQSLKMVQEEIDLQVGKERLVNESDIDKLVYLQAVVKESLRLYPTAPLSGPREFNSDCIVGGYHVPKGTRLLVNLWKLHRDSSVWSNPLDFNPDRFLKTHNNIDLRGQQFELMPFGAGRRSCPGINLGLQMVHIALASLLQAFEITTPMDKPVDMTASPGLTSIKSTPLEILVKPRLGYTLYE